MPAAPSTPAATRPVVLLARHGETAWNREGRLQGNRDIPLSEAGVAQAAALARRLRGAGLARVVSSDLSRAVETARPVADAAGLPVETDAGLREQDLGAWEGLTFAQVEAADAALAARFRAYDPAARPPGGETRGETAARVWSTLSAIAPPGSPSPLLVVAHGGTIQFIVYHVLGLSLSQPRRFAMPNASISTLAPRGDGWLLRSLSDVAHLDPSAVEWFPFV